MPDGTSKWLVIAQKSKVSIRTLTNICSGTYEAPRQKTLRGLDAVRKWMSPASVKERERSKEYKRQRRMSEKS